MNPFLRVRSNFLNLVSITSLLVLASITDVFAQDITTEGKDFWLGFMENREQNGEIILEIYISAADSTGGTVTLPLGGWSQDFSVEDNSTVLVTVPTDLAMAEGSGNIQNMGIHVQANDNVSVYALNKVRVSADATVVLPKPALGRTYYVSSYYGGTNWSDSEFLLVAVEDDSQIDITPASTTRDGHTAGSTYTVTLDSGQVVQVQARGDLTGTKLRASGSCKPFAAFGGNEWTRVGGCQGAQDHLYEQMFPVGAWGKKFGTVPYRTRIGGDEFTILAANDETTIEISGREPFVLNEGQSVLRLLDSASFISADKPIQVTQFSRSQSCDNQLADPFMIVLSPLEQSLKKITYNAPNVTQIQNYFTNIITRTDAVADLLFDGFDISPNFLPYKYDSTYSYARLLVSVGNHTIESLSGFNAYIYGYGQIESFGYATGARLDNLNLVVSSFNETSGQFTGEVCRGDKVTFEVTSKRSFAEFEWNFRGEKIIGNSVEYTFDEGGDYFITVTGVNGFTSGCADQETAVKLIKVLQPDIEVLGPRSVCPFSPGVEYIADDESPNNTREWFVEGGTLNSGQGSKTIKVDWGDTNDMARVRLLTRNALGCFGDTIDFPVKINIQLDPSAPLGLDSLCSSEINDVPYFVYPTPTSVYDWKTENGNITSADGSNEITATWDGPGTAKIWYEESSTLDDVCSGISDTLNIFIEREPDENLTIVLDKGEYQIEEPINFNFEGDENFNFISWKFGDGAGIDSIARETPVEHFLKCPGQYKLELSAYTGTVCQNIGSGTAEINILDPILETLYVSNHESMPNTLEIDGAHRNTNFYSRPILWEKRLVEPMPTSWTAFASFSSNAHLDENLLTDEYVYEYRLQASTACNQEYLSIEHNNLLLEVEKDSIGIVQSVLDRNNYNNWNNGVSHYEVWRSIDDEAYELIGEMPAPSLEIPYENNGFDHCYRVKAVELGGNQTIAWSNDACTSFVPELTFYNVFSPNGDFKNDYFEIQGIENFMGSVLTVVNRYGKTVYSAIGYQNDWAGTTGGGSLIASGVYYFTVELNEPRAKEQFLRGSFTILR
ncbi:MAG: gliding motility-associated C-terminal domain-containing protein [Cyclobacteriaceae bacterium]